MASMHSINRSDLNMVLSWLPPQKRSLAQASAKPMLACLDYGPGNVEVWLAPFGIDKLTPEHRAEVIADVMDSLEHEMVADAIRDAVELYVEEQVGLDDDRKIAPRLVDSPNCPHCGLGLIFERTVGTDYAVRGGKLEAVDDDEEWDVTCPDGCALSDRVKAPLIEQARELAREQGDIV